MQYSGNNYTTTYTIKYRKQKNKKDEKSKFINSSIRDDSFIYKL